MPFEEIDTEDSANSLSNVSTFDNDFARIQFVFSSFSEDVTDDGLDLQI
jgi:hypothetical protein